MQRVNPSPIHCQEKNMRSGNVDINNVYRFLENNTILCHMKRKTKTEAYQKV